MECKADQALFLAMGNVTCPAIIANCAAHLEIGSTSGTAIRTSNWVSQRIASPVHCWRGTGCVPDHQYRTGQGNTIGMSVLVWVYVASLFLCSAVTVVLFGWDKQRARQGRRRIPEKTLLGLAFLGGWPGALFAQRAFRHKTQKVSFRIILWSLIALHLSLVVAVGVTISRNQTGP